MTETLEHRNGNGFRLPEERRLRSPLMTEAGYRLYQRIRQHPDAPRWNHVLGDRVHAEDLEQVQVTREAVHNQRRAGTGSPGPEILEWVRSMRPRVPLFRRHLPEGFDLERDWGYIPTMSREDLAARIETVVPTDSDLSRLIVYDTSGTTGHALVVPHHPRAVAQNHPLVEFALERYGVRPSFGPEMVACINACAQAETYVFANVFSVWNQAGFAKVNLNGRDWNGDPERARRFFADLDPCFVTGDPVTFSEMIRWEIPVRPAALLSTALALSPGLAAALEQRFGCPAIDWYSTTETGPIAYASPQGDGLHLLPVDLYVEIVDEEGFPLPPGEHGEIAVTGGRNPYLPLLRYRTGDRARLLLAPGPSGDPMPRLADLVGRKIVFFRAVDGSLVNPVDISRTMRLCCPFVQHRFLQRADGSCEVTIRPVAGLPLDPERIEQELRRLFGPTQRLTVQVDQFLGQDSTAGKVVSFESELELGC
ncbi:MAG: phenylacetate--CoA ligase family protein [Bradymonadales bacterium]|nr:phenylacetate--CoA ligase family protein [Bradymonadales bacterium]